MGIVVQRRADHFDDDLVGDQLALIHIAFSRQAQRGLTGNLAAEEVSRAEVLQTVPTHQSFGLRTFATAGRAE